ncbi:MAG: ribbon-helix-helix protein, CopG family [Acetobacteraceae bacterium]
MNKIVTARVDDDLVAELDALAQITGRTKSALISQAIRSYVASERAFITKVEAGLADFEAGRTVDLETVVAAVRRSIRSVP